MASESDSSALQKVLLLVIVLIIGFTGWYAWHAKNSADKTLASANKATTAEVTLPATTKYTFPVEKMTIAYGKQWSVVSSNHDSNSCGPSDQLTLKHANFVLNFGFGSICGKGSAPCFADSTSSCKTESQAVKTIHPDSKSTAYIIAYRTTTDGGQTWTYSLGLTSAASCNSDFCVYTPENMPTSAGGTTISGSETPLPNGISSLSQFVALSNVKDAVTVLQTAHY